MTTPRIPAHRGALARTRAVPRAGSRGASATQRPAARNAPSVFERAPKRAPLVAPSTTTMSRGRCALLAARARAIGASDEPLLEGVDSAMRAAVDTALETTPELTAATFGARLPADRERLARYHPVLRVVEAFSRGTPAQQNAAAEFLERMPLPPRLRAMLLDAWRPQKRPPAEARSPSQASFGTALFAPPPPGLPPSTPLTPAQWKLIEGTNYNRFADTRNRIVQQDDATLATAAPKDLANIALAELYPAFDPTNAKRASPKPMSRALRRALVAALDRCVDVAAPRGSYSIPNDPFRALVFGGVDDGDVAALHQLATRYLAQTDARSWWLAPSMIQLADGGSLAAHPVARKLDALWSAGTKPLVPRRAFALPADLDASAAPDFVDLRSWSHGVCAPAVNNSYGFGKERPFPLRQSTVRRIGAEQIARTVCETLLREPAQLAGMCKALDDADWSLEVDRRSDRFAASGVLLRGVFDKPMRAADATPESVAWLTKLVGKMSAPLDAISVEIAGGETVPLLEHPLLPRSRALTADEQDHVDTALRGLTDPTTAVASLAALVQSPLELDELLAALAGARLQGALPISVERLPAPARALDGMLAGFDHLTALALIAGAALDVDEAALAAAFVRKGHDARHAGDAAELAAALAAMSPARRSATTAAAMPTRFSCKMTDLKHAVCGESISQAVRGLSAGSAAGDGAQVAAAARSLARAAETAPDATDADDITMGVLDRMLAAELSEKAPLDAAQDIADRVLEHRAHEASARQPAPAGSVRLGEVLLERRAPEPGLDVAAIPTSSSLVMTCSTERNLERLARAWRSRRPVFLEGPPGAGKTSAVEHIARATQTPLRRINLSPTTDIDDLLGRYVDGPEGPVWSDGPVVQAMRHGECLLIDEANTAPDDVIERVINPLFDSRQLTLDERGGAGAAEVVVAHPELRVFGTGNPASTTLGRKTLSDAARSRWVSVYLEGHSVEDLLQILLTRFAGALPVEQAAPLVATHELLAKAAEDRILSGGVGDLAFTIRDLVKVAERFVKLRGLAAPGAQPISDDALLRREIEEVYGARFFEPEERAAFDDILRVSLKAPATPAPARGTLRVTPTALQLRELTVDRLGIDHPRVPGANAMLAMTPRVEQALYQIVKAAVVMRENVVLVGDSAAGKTGLVLMLGTLMGQPVFRQVFGRDTDAAQLIGTFTPRWQDGPLLQAGRPENPPGIYFPDELNLAPSAFTERLNSALDDGRKLVLAEKTDPKDSEVTLQRDLRIIGAMNPASIGSHTFAGRKPLSTALQNRVTVIFVPACDDPDEQREIARARAGELGLPTWVADATVALHGWVTRAVEERRLARDAASPPVLTLRHILGAIETIAELVSNERGPPVALAEAMRLALGTRYASSSSKSDDAAVKAEVEVIVEEAARQAKTPGAPAQSTPSPGGQP